MKETIFTGIIEFDRKPGGVLRKVSTEIEACRDDPYVGPDLIKKHNIREGSLLEASIRRGKRGGAEVDSVIRINGLVPEEWRTVTDYSQRVAIDPNERIKLTVAPSDTSMRIVDLLCPLGKGQRALIVSPPKAGKTILMQQFAHAISANHPEIELIVLLVDERPEEVTEMRRSIKGQVFASSNDSSVQNHVRLARLVLEYAKRKVEAGNEVVLLVDSLTRMGRAFNAAQRGSGRTMSGGVDIRALEIPKKIFGAARALEGEGSLTILATALIETNSRMDELIFQEFKGTGNMELVLDRELSDLRIFPAIDIPKSGTRREELLFGGDTGKYQLLRRSLHRMRAKDAMLALKKLLEKYPTNQKLLLHLSDIKSEL